MKYIGKTNAITGLAVLLGAIGISSGAMAQSCLLAAQYPDETPDSRYNVHGDGTVSDSQTNLMWMRCSIGQTLSSPSCAGAATTDNWQQALATPAGINIAGFAGYQDWRLPNIRELRSLAKYNCTDPAINEIIFPNVAYDYWSVSPYANDGSLAWRLSFGSGGDSADFRVSSKRVRLVRTGP